MAKPKKQKTSKTGKAQAPKDLLKGKYRSLYLWGVLFLLIGVAILVFNHLTANALSRDVRLLNAAEKQTVSASKIRNTMESLHQEYLAEQSTGEKAEQLFKELQKNFESYGTTQSSLVHGGKSRAVDGLSDLIFKPVQDQSVRTQLLGLQPVWVSLGDKLARIVAQGSSTPALLVDEAAKESVSFAEKAMISYEAVAEIQKNKLDARLIDQRKKQTIITGSTLFAYIWLLLITVRGLRKKDNRIIDQIADTRKKNKELERLNVGIGKAFERLKDKHQQLQEAQQMTVSAKESMEDYANEVEVKTTQLTKIKEESDAILSTISHGLCLLDKEGKMSERISRAMETIFEKESLGGTSFLDLLKPLISEKDFKTLQSYIGLQFQAKTRRKQLDKYNPLKKIEVNFVRENGSHVVKHLGFDFRRIYSGADISSVLVTVMDVTDKVSLASDLKRAEQQKNRQADLMFELVNLNARDVRAFLSKAERELEQVNSILREGQDQQTPSNQSEKVEKIFRSIHMLKGSASMLGLRTVVQNCEATEEELKVLRTEGEVSGDRFLASLVGIVKLKQTLGEIEELCDTLLTNTSFKKKNADAAASHSGTADIVGSITKLAERVASRENKEVIVDTAGFDISHIHQEQSDGVEDVLIQLVRNSLAHGIELPEERTAAGKSSQGRIRISSLLSPEGPVPDFGPCLTISFSDDGRGLDIAEIAKRAVKKGFISSEQASQMSPQQLSAIIFRPGFSTSGEVSEDSGQGVGLDVVRDTIVNKLGGKLRIAYKTAKSFELTAYLPHKAT